MKSQTLRSHLVLFVRRVMMAFALCVKGLNHLWQIDDF